MSNATTIPARTAKAIAASVESWFDSAQRDLPWRANRSGYAALVSELMLQQTQVSRVIDIFNRFMDRFPTVDALAAASEQDVLAAWQGLGYYRRARFLHAAARAVVEQHNSIVPEAACELQALPGIGRYTAGAIASIVFGHAEPIVDGNVKRVLSRLFAEHPDHESWFWSIATELVQQATRPGAFNEGLMELGATVCTPKQPDCPECPLRRRCAARKANTVDDYPPPKEVAARTVVHHHCVVVHRDDAVLLEQRAGQGLWSDMWQPPSVEAADELGVDQLLEQLSIKVSSLDAVETFRHLTSHRDVRFHVYVARTRTRSGQWCPIVELESRPMSNAHKRVLRTAGVTV